MCFDRHMGGAACLDEHERVLHGHAVVGHRVPDEDRWCYPTALLEVAEAMRLILDHAEAWHVDPARIAVLGFSAGGHLAADFATSASDGVLRAHGYDPALLAPTALMLA